ncbi:MAG: Ran-binding domain-containing protein [archaeon]|nr:Ran-binding domain-containing protein [archaeon]
MAFETPTSPSAADFDFGTSESTDNPFGTFDTEGTGFDWGSFSATGDNAWPASTEGDVFSTGDSAASATASSEAPAETTPAAAEEEEDPNAGHDDTSLEPDEDVIYRERGLLYRLDPVERAWKERGTGVIKLLQHRETKRIRILMRRDHVLKVCANHFITPHMIVKPNAGSDKSYVWTSLADYADEEPKKETFALKFGTADRMFCLFSAHFFNSPTTPLFTLFIYLLL